MLGVSGDIGEEGTASTGRKLRYFANTAVPCPLDEYEYICLRERVLLYETERLDVLSLKKSI